MCAHGTVLLREGSDCTRAVREIVLLTDALGLEMMLLCWSVGLGCGLVDKHSDSAETGANVPRVPFSVGNAGINFENLRRWFSCAGLG